MENRLNYYDIYGFVLAVDEDMKEAFDLEYWRFKKQKPKKVDVYVLKTNKKNLPITLRHDNKGIYIPFGKNENKVYYEPGVRPDWVLYSIEPLIRWKDKCFLHCGAVSKEGKAVLFPAEGGVGKTTMATYLVSKGYEYLSDDWLIIGNDGRAYPFFKTLHIYDYNLKKDKEMSKRILGKAKYYYYSTLIGLLDLFQEIIPNRFVKIVVERLKPIFSIDVKKIHPNAKLGSISKIENVYWLKKDKALKKPILRKLDYRLLAEKMPYITALEINHFTKNYLDWVYKNPSNEDFEKKIEKDKELMIKAFKNAKVYELLVPSKINPTEVSKMIGLI